MHLDRRKQLAITVIVGLLVVYAERNKYISASVAMGITLALTVFVRFFYTQ